MNRREFSGISATSWGLLIGALLAGVPAAAQVVAPPAAVAAAPEKPKPKPKNPMPLTVDVVVTNGRTVTLTELFVSASGSPEGTKIVDPLAPGGKYVARLSHDKDCLFDIRADYEDGSSSYAATVALCRDKKINLVDPVPQPANVIDGGIRPVDSMCDWYDVEWDEMTNAEQQAWAALGWRADNWGTEDPKAAPASDTKDWDELNATEKQAALSLGFVAKTWNPDPDPCETKTPPPD